MNKKFPTSALVIVDNKSLLPYTLNFLYKFNFKKIFLLKKKQFDLNPKILKKYSFKFKLKSYPKTKFSYDFIKKENSLDFLDKDFLLLKSSKFINLNLFKLYKMFLNEKKKLIVTISNKNKQINHAEIFFLKKSYLSFYDFSFKQVLKNQNYKLNFTDSEYFDCNKKKHDKKIINNFFSKIYSKAVILDRDGVININKGYVGYKKDFLFQKGAIKAIKYLNDYNYNIFVVSNQSGIARGYFSNNDVKKLHIYLRDVLCKNYSTINKIYFSPYHKDGIIKKYSKYSSCRKPGIKLFKVLTKEWNITDKKNLIMIGDQKSDMEFAKNAKINFAFFLEGNLYKFIKNLKFIKKMRN